MGGTLPSYSNQLGPTGALYPNLFWPIQRSPIQCVWPSTTELGQLGEGLHGPFYDTGHVLILPLCGLGKGPPPQRSGCLYSEAVFEPLLLNDQSKAQGAGKGDLFQLTIDEPQRWGTRVFRLGGFLKNHWGDSAVLKILRLESKAANVSPPVSKVNSLDPGAQGQILPPSSNGTDRLHYT
jgi:hypothetical protein